MRACAWTNAGRPLRRGCWNMLQTVNIPRQAEGCCKGATNLPFLDEVEPLQKVRRSLSWNIQRFWCSAPLCNRLDNQQLVKERHKDRANLKGAKANNDIGILGKSYSAWSHCVDKEMNEGPQAKLQVTSGSQGQLVHLRLQKL